MSAYPLEELAKKLNKTVGDLVRETLTEYHWNKTLTAGKLEVTRQGLYKAMKAWNIPQRDPSKPPKRKRKLAVDKRTNKGL